MYNIHQNKALEKQQGQTSLFKYFKNLINIFEWTIKFNMYCICKVDGTLYIS